MRSPPGQSWVCYLWEEWTGLVQFRFKVASLPLGGPWGTCCDQEACSTWKGGLRGSTAPHIQVVLQAHKGRRGGYGHPQQRAESQCHSQQRSGGAAAEPSPPGARVPRGMGTEPTQALALTAACPPRSSGQPHGGERPGAGRKPALTPLVALESEVWGSARAPAGQRQLPTAAWVSRAASGPEVFRAEMDWTSQAPLPPAAASSNATSHSDCHIQGRQVSSACFGSPQTR